MDGLVIGVVAGCGGIGASRLAAVLAQAAATLAGCSLLADLDPAGGGIDVLLGAEAVPGARWSGLRLAGGVLDPQLLLAGVPQWGNVALLACDRAASPTAGEVGQVIDSVAPVVPVVLDLARVPSPARSVALTRCALVVLVAAVDLAAIAAARSVLLGLDGARVAVVARGSRAATTEAAELIGAPLAGRLPPRRRRDGTAMRAGDGRGSMQRVARGLLTGLISPGSTAPAPLVEVDGRWVPGLEVAR